MERAMQCDSTPGSEHDPREMQDDQLPGLQARELKKQNEDDPESSCYKEPGLTDLGNTCYMKSALQCLSNTEPLTEYFIQQPLKKPSNKDSPSGTVGAVTEAYSTLVREMWSECTSTYSPERMKAIVERFAPQFSGYQQHDSQEFLAFLLQSLHEDLNIVEERPYDDMMIDTEGRKEEDVADEFWYKHLQQNQSIVVDLFQGQLMSTVECSQCNQVSKTFDPFTILSVPLPVKQAHCASVVTADPVETVAATEDPSGEASSELSTAFTLFNCFELFTKKKHCGPSDGHFCPHCKKVMQATRKCDVWKLPPVLVIYLTQLTHKDQQHKSCTLVCFPIKELDLSKFMKVSDQPAPTYDLFAVIDCSDTAYCKDKATGKWYCYSDTEVSEVSEDKILTCAAYMLFYGRQEKHCAALKRPHSPLPAHDVKRQRSELSEIGFKEGEDKIKQENEMKHTYAAKDSKALAEKGEEQGPQQTDSSVDAEMEQDEEDNRTQTHAASEGQALAEEEEGEGLGHRLTESSVDVEMKQEEEEGDRGQSSFFSSRGMLSTFSSWANRVKQWYNKEPGICGLSNLGNTCYMNSALQCLSNTEPLTDYFVQNEFGKDINKDNPLGMGGAVAEAYGALLQDLWDGQSSTCTPREMKGVIETFAPQFFGHHQHDSHELLTFLLDGLHEDLNLVREKPYVDMTIETKGMEEKDVADEYWDKHLLRNQSIVVDLFQGQLMSTMECLQCNEVTKTFDPFFSLELPVKETRSVSVVLVRADPVAPMVKYCVDVPKNGTVKNLKEELSTMTEIKEEMLMVINVSKKHYVHECNDSKPLSAIQGRDSTLVYELSHPLADPDWMHVFIVHRMKIFQDTHSARAQYQYFWVPTYISVPQKKCTHHDLYQAVFDKCQKYVSQEEKKREEGGTSEEVVKHKEMFHLVNAGQKLKNDDTPFHYNGRSTMFCEWSMDLNLAEAIIEDPSCDTGPEPSQDTSLFKCLNLFTKKKKLGTDDAWFCPNCTALVKSTRKCDIWKLPPVLVVHLTRFIHNRHQRQKSCTFVHFPIKKLDLSKYMKAPDQPEPIYDLFAVINHSGSIGGGHYTAYCKNKTTEKWYRYDDTQVSEMLENQVLTRSAYVLFYCCSEKTRFTLKTLPSQLPAQNVRRQRNQLTMKDSDEGDENMELGDMAEEMAQKSAALKRSPSQSPVDDVKGLKNQTSEPSLSSADGKMEGTKSIGQKKEQECAALKTSPSESHEKDVKRMENLPSESNNDVDIELEDRAGEKDKDPPAPGGPPTQSPEEDVRRQNQSPETGDEGDEKEELHVHDMAKEKEQKLPSPFPAEGENNEPIEASCDKGVEMTEIQGTAREKKQKSPPVKLMYYSSYPDQASDDPEAIVILPLGNYHNYYSQMSPNEVARGKRWNWCPCCSIL